MPYVSYLGEISQLFSWEITFLEISSLVVLMCSCWGSGCPNDAQMSCLLRSWYEFVFWIELLAAWTYVLIQRCLQSNTPVLTCMFFSRALAWRQLNQNLTWRWLAVPQWDRWSPTYSPAKPSHDQLEQYVDLHINPSNATHAMHLW